MSKLPEKYKKYEGHTEGEWRIHNGKPNVVMIRGKEGDNFDVVYAEVWRGLNVEVSEIDATAKLIADAPMLLEQLIAKESQLNEAVELLRLVRGSYYTEDPLLREIDDYLNSIGGSDESKM
jgi:hypothetical protein